MNQNHYEPPKKVPIIFIVILAIFLTALLAGGFSYYYLSINEQKRKEEIDNLKNQLFQLQNSLTRKTPASQSVVNTPLALREEKKNYAKDYLFYTKLNPDENAYNVFMSNKLGKNEIQLTDFKKVYGMVIQPYELQVIDDQYIGYTMMDPVGKNFKVYKLDPFSKKSEEIYQLKGGEIILSFTWYDKNTFAYTYAFEDGPISLILFKNGIITSFQTKSKMTSRGGGVLDDDERLSFSPNGKNILFFSTSSFIYTPYIFDLGGKELAEIQKATHPQWLNDQTIIFRRPKEGGIYSFNLQNKKESKFKNIDNSSYDPRVLKGTNKFVYWINKNQGEVWLMDVKNNKAVKLLDKAMKPFWLSSDEIMVMETKSLTKEEKEDLIHDFGLSFVQDSLMHYKIYGKVKTKINSLNINDNPVGYYGSFY